MPPQDENPEHHEDANPNAHAAVAQVDHRTDTFMKHARPPKPLVFTSNKPEAWKLFERLWRNYVKLSGLDTRPRDIQLAMLESHFGEEALRVYDGLPFTMTPEERTMEDVLVAMRTYAVGTINESYERFVFRSRRQDENEAFNDFYASLRKLSVTCNFCVQCRDTEIRDQVILGIRNHEVREDLLKVNPLTLEKCVDICKAAENAEAHGRGYQQAVTRKTDSVHKMMKSKKPQPRFPAKPERKSEPSHASKPHASAKCKFCGKNHQMKKELCPAYGKKCNKCKGNNHFANMCTAKVHRLYADSSDDDWARSINSSHSKEYKCRFMVDGASIHFQLDTGSTVNLMPVKNAGCHLQPYKGRLKTWNNKTLHPVGKCMKTIVNPKDGKKHDIEFVVFDDEQCQPILGLRTCEQLNLLEIRSENFERVFQVSKESDVFDKDTLGCLPGKQSLTLRDSAIPVVMADRRTPIHVRPQLEKELQRMTKLGVIAPVKEATPWMSQIVIVTKKDGSLRICLDPHELNKVLIRERSSLPILEDVLYKLKDAKMFTKADLASAYWHVELDHDASMLTTFNTHMGRFRWLRLPFGLCVASEILQSKLQSCLGDLEGVVFLADDVVIFGATQTEHDKNYQAFIARCQEVGIRLNQKKLELRKQHIDFMGHRIGNGVQVDPQKISAIQGMETPKNVTELRRFIGMVNFLGKFIKNLSALIAPLANLLKKDVPWTWSQAQDEALNRVKETLTSAPVLRMYDPTLPTTLENDASEYGIGSAIMQQGQPVAYASRLLSESERRYAQIEKEMLAVVFGLERFHHYVFGGTVEVITDHKPLEAISRKPLSKAPRRLQNLLLRAQHYTFFITHRKGVEIPLADCLSRAPTDKPKKEDLVNAVTLHPVGDARMREIKHATSLDPELQDLGRLILQGWPRSTSDVPDSVKPYFHHRDEISIHQGIIYRGDRIVVPCELRQLMTTKVHAGHIGINATLRRARTAMYWPGMSTAIRQMVEACPACATYQAKQAKESLVITETPDRPWSRVAADLFKYGGKEFLLLTDYTSNWFEVDELASAHASDIIQKLKVHFARFGIPEVLVSDNGPQFSAREFSEFARMWQFTHETISPGNSQSNGAAERAVGIIKQIWRRCSASEDDEWLGLMNVRNTPSEGLATSPAERLLGHRCRTQVPERLPNQTSAEAQKKTSMRTRSVAPMRDLPKLQPGDGVRIQPYDGSKRWKPGRVNRQLSSRAYEVEVEGRHLRRNRRMLRFHPTSVPGPRLRPTSGSSPLAQPHTDETPPITTPMDGTPPEKQPQGLPASLQQAAAPVSPHLRRSKRPTTKPKRLIEEV